MVLPSMNAIKYSPKLIVIDGTFHHHNWCTMVFSTTITQEKNVIVAGLSIGTTESVQVIEPLIEMMKKTARENGVDPNELKFISDSGSAIIKCLSGCTHFNCTFHIANNLIKYVKRETGVSVSSEDGKVINTLSSEIAETADITEAVRKIWTTIDIFRKGLSSGTQRS